MDKRKLIVNKKLPQDLAQIMFAVWAQFTYANEVVNCIGQVWVPKPCGMLAKPRNPFEKRL